MSSLTVHLDRDDDQGLVAPESFTARQPFDVMFENQGRGTRVHLHLDDGLARVASLADGNQFVPGDATKRVRVDVANVEEAVTGTLTLSVDYGAKSQDVAVTIEPYLEDEDAGSGVDVDERLSKPAPKESDPESPFPSLSNAAFVALSLGALAVAIALVIVVESPLVVLGAVLVALAVIGTLGVARS